MEDFWKMVIGLFVKLLLEWLANQNEETAAKAGNNFAVAKMAYDKRTSEA